MPHRPGHGRYESDNTEADKINEARKRKQKSIDVRKSAYDTFKGTGISGIGGADVETRRKRSIDRGWTPPEGGGRITETKPSGKTTVTTFVDDDDDKGKTEKVKEQYDDVEHFWNEDLGTWDIRIAQKNIPLLEQKLGRKISYITADGTIVFADKMGGKPTFMKLADALSGTLDKWTGFNPDKALTKGGMGDQGKAVLWNKLKDMSPGEFQDFLNRKGNLDRIMEFAGQGAAGGPSPNFDMNKLKSGGREYLMSLLEGTGGEDFQMLKLKNSSDKEERRRYYELNPPRTQGDLEEAAMAGITYIPGYGPVERPDRGGGQQAGGGGIGDVPTTPTDPTDPNIPTPDYYLKIQYMPGFTPSYTGGPEQMQIAGGYYDPVTKKFIGNPYGTANQYQFAQGGIVGTSPLLFKNQGGMASDNGIKSFKKYGY
jgi:hypothetical protein